MSVPMFIFLSKVSSTVNAVVASDIDVLEFFAIEIVEMHNVNIAKLGS